MNSDVSDNLSEARPSKRQKGPSSTPSRSRGQTACDKCRERKTKCDNVRPVCGYCAKHQIACFYADDTILDIRQDVGLQILSAVEDLSSTVTNFLTSQQSTHNARDHVSALRARSIISPDTPRTKGFSIDQQSLRQSEAQGIESLLSWPVLAGIRPKVPLYNDQAPDRLTDILPNLNHSELVRLANRYIEAVHVMNPILDLTQLDELIAQFAEHGLDWSARTCLVTLACAIGSASEVTSVGEINSASLSNITQRYQTSLQFWSIAVKRIGLLIGHHTVEAIQCLCLAGIYASNRLQPLTAWKYFSLAGASWSSLNLMQKMNSDNSRRDSTQSFTTMESLYFTIWKSECEILIEIDLPGPLLDRVGFAFDFPRPPMPAVASPQPVLAEEQRIWFYYLAEIAARHLINRIIKWPVSASSIRNDNELRSMIDRADFLDSQIDDWYGSLPPFLQQGIPRTLISCPQQTDDFCMVLRHRYWHARGLIRRPFVELCVGHSAWMNDVLKLRIIGFATEHIQYCLLKVPDIPPHVHQGTWVGLRTIVACVLTCTALELARRDPQLSLAHEVNLAKDWQVVVRDALQVQDMAWKVAAAETEGLYSLAVAALASVR